MLYVLGIAVLYNLALFYFLAKFSNIPIHIFQRLIVDRLFVVRNEIYFKIANNLAKYLNHDDVGVV